MTSPLLVDAGPLVALLCESDPGHIACAELLGKIRSPLLTTWPPVTEAMHMLWPVPGARDNLLELLEAGHINIADLDQGDMPYIRRLMKQYADLPMDFADATLVHVANREGLRDIFTLDQRDFSVYRLKGGRHFNVLPRA